MGQVGTKHGAISSDQEQYLTNVGEAKILTKKDTSLAEVLGTCTRSSTTTETNLAPFWCICCHLHTTAKEPEESLERMWRDGRNTLSYTSNIIIMDGISIALF